MQQQQRRRGGLGGGGEGEAEGEAAVVEVVLPPPRGVRVKTAEFVKSSVNVEQCPPARFPEFAGEAAARLCPSACLRPAAACPHSLPPPAAPVHESACCQRCLAVIGRSNVGKSSLINMLTGRNSLAMVSKTPGALPLLG